MSTLATDLNSPKKTKSMLERPWTRAALTAIAIGSLSTVAHFSCKTNGPDPGSETPWFQVCVDQSRCGPGLDCTCGVCTATCDNTQCPAGRGRCFAVDSTATTTICSADEITPLCLPECSEGDRCEDGLRCVGGSCMPSIARARGLLELVKLDEACAAFEGIEGADAAFSAGICRLLKLAEGPVATKILNEFNLPPLSVAEILGRQGYLGRAAVIWRGSGTLVATGEGIDERLDFSRTRVAVRSDGSTDQGLDARHWVDPREASLELDFPVQRDGKPLKSGDTIALDYACDDFRFIDPAARGVNVRLQFTRDTVRYDCFNLFAEQCEGERGKLTLAQLTAAKGNPAELQLDRVYLRCHPSPAHSGGALPGSSSSLAIRVSGTFTDILTERRPADSQLHTLFQTDGTDALLRAPDSLTLTRLVDLARPLIGDLESIIDHFVAAYSAPPDGGFTIPADLFGARKDVPVSAADLKALTAGLLFVQAGIMLADSYQTSLRLNAFACEHPPCVCANPPCGDDERDLTAYINANLGRLKAAHRALEAKLKMVEGATLAQGALAEVSADSVIANNAVSAAGLQVVRDLLEALLQTMQSDTAVGLPHVTPTIGVILQRAFDSPPDPDAATMDPVVCESADLLPPEPNRCSVTLVSGFFDELTAPFLPDIDWAELSAYDFQKRTELERLDEEIGRFVRRHLTELYEILR